LAILWALLWSITAVGRLADVGWSRWIALAYILPWSAFIWALVQKNLWAFFVALVTLIAFQIPLMLIPGRSRVMDGKQAKHMEP
jgi:uncharacterized membrane protein YhaH (DUF805 family)